MPLILQTSGGTTGLPRPMIFTPRDREVMNIITGRRLYMQGVRPFDLVQVALSMGLTNGGVLAREGILEIYRCGPGDDRLGRPDADAPPDRVAEGLESKVSDRFSGLSAPHGPGRPRRAQHRSARSAGEGLDRASRSGRPCLARTALGRGCLRHLRLQRMRHDGRRVQPEERHACLRGRFRARGQRSRHFAAETAGRAGSGVHHHAFQIRGADDSLQYERRHLSGARRVQLRQPAGAGLPESTVAATTW